MKRQIQEFSSNWLSLKQELNSTKKATKGHATSFSKLTKIKKKGNKFKRNAADSHQGSQSKKTKPKVLALDCEYVGVGFSGKEDMLARVSIVNYEGEQVYDKYVRPSEPVTDYRTKVSGVRRGHLLLKGEPFQQVQQEVNKLLAGSIVVGHAVHNDFRVLRLEHPKRLIRDTSKYPPLRKMVGSGVQTPSLKLLAHHILGLQIQQGEHDSIADARNALIIYKMNQKRWDGQQNKERSRKRH